MPEEGRGNLYKVPIAGGRPVRVAAPKIGGFTGLSVPGTASKLVLVVQYGSSVNPAEVVRVDPARKYPLFVLIHGAAASYIPTRSGSSAKSR